MLLNFLKAGNHWYVVVLELKSQNGGNKSYADAFCCVAIFKLQKISVVEKMFFEWQLCHFLTIGVNLHMACSVCMLFAC